MNYRTPLEYHFATKKGWINDPNGLVYFGGYYHIFYQHAPDFEKPWKENMHWGHARTKDFLTYEELPVALFPDKPSFDRHNLEDLQKSSNTSKQSYASNAWFCYTKKTASQETVFFILLRKSKNIQQVLFRLFPTFAQISYHHINKRKTI